MQTITYTEMHALVTKLPESKLPLAYRLLHSLTASEGESPQAKFMRLSPDERRLLLSQQAEQMRDHYEQTADERAEWQSGILTEYNIMAFSDFKAIPEVQERFGIRHVENDFIELKNTADPSKEFLQEFDFNRDYIDVLASEGARCEAIIFPVLREVYKGYAEDYALWIKKPIAYDDVLSGTPDYFISTRSELGKLVVGTPLIMLVEAKKNDFEIGWGQCLAELVAAQKINENPELPVFGIVSDGTLWQIGHLVGETFIQNRTSFSVDNLPVLFGAIDSLFKAAKNSAQ